VTHGTRSAYNAGCRCDDCRAAQRLYQRGYYARTKHARGDKLDPANCGTKAQYDYHRCRCTACRKANADYMWRLRAIKNGTPELLEQPRRDRRLRPPKTNAALPPGSRLDERERAILEGLLA
jgi:hypothetical protein